MLHIAASETEKEANMKVVEVCQFFSNTVIPYLESIFEDEWVNHVDYGVERKGGNFYLKFLTQMEEMETHLNNLRRAVIEWFGEAIEGVTEWLNEQLLNVRFREPAPVAA